MAQDPKTRMYLSEAIDEMDKRIKTIVPVLYINFITYIKLKILNISYYFQKVRERGPEIMLNNSTQRI